MDDDIELGRFAVHGTIAGGAHALRVLIETDPALSRVEKDARQLAVTLGQGIFHIGAEAVAAAIQARRNE